MSANDPARHGRHYTQCWPHLPYLARSSPLPWPRPLDRARQTRNDVDKGRGCPLDLEGWDDPRSGGIFPLGTVWSYIIPIWNTTKDGLTLTYPPSSSPPKTCRFWVWLKIVSWNLEKSNLYGATILINLVWKPFCNYFESSEDLSWEDQGGARSGSDGQWRFLKKKL